MKSLRSMDLSEINRYVHSLIMLASVSIMLRIIWVLDVIIQVRKAVKDSQETGDENGTNNSNNDNSTDNSDGSTVRLNDKAVVTFGIQVNNCYVICIIFSSV